MKKLSDVFDIRNGNQLSLNRLSLTTPEIGVPFISRKAVDNGVAAYVRELATVEPNPAGELTCALSGQGGVMTTFLQDRPYYTAFHVARLRPLVELTAAQKFYYCICITANHYRYGWGRQANRTIKNILVPSPEEIPVWLNDPAIQLTAIADRAAMEFGRLEKDQPSPDSEETGWQTVSDLFEIKYGHSYELCHLTLDRNGVNFVSRRTGNNGVSARVKHTGDAPAPAGSLTVALGGSVLETYLQPAPFYCGRDIAVLSAKKSMTTHQKLFYALSIKRNCIRFNYGRQANRTLPFLRLPALPEWFKSCHLVDVRADLRRRIRAIFK